MPTLLKFTLSEDAAAAFYDALLCLNRFSDDVSFDATREKVSFPAIVPLRRNVSTDRPRSSCRP